MRVRPAGTSQFVIVTQLLYLLANVHGRYENQPRLQTSLAALPPRKHPRRGSMGEEGERVRLTPGERRDAGLRKVLQGALHRTVSAGSELRGRISFTLQIMTSPLRVVWRRSRRWDRGNAPR